MKFIEYPDQEFMMMDLADTIAGELNGFLTHEERVTLAVPGGTTPGPVFDSLSAAAIDWDRVTVLLTDERWVPESHARSNTRLVRERLMTGRAAAAHLLPMVSDAATPEEGFAPLAEAVEPLLPLSVVLLGMGEDMHTASLFPGAAGLAAALKPEAPPLMPMRTEAAGEPRITLTAAALKDAMSVHILITGSAKRAALERARELNDPLRAPVSAVLAHATVHWAQ